MNNLIPKMVMLRTKGKCLKSFRHAFCVA